MSSRPLSSLDYADSELVLGIVSPVGSNINAVAETLRNYLHRFGYGLNELKLSDFLKELNPRRLKVKLKESPELLRIMSFQDAGNRVRDLAKRGDVLALAAVQRILQKRDKAEPLGSEKPLPSTVHFLNSLKHPDEVKALRKIYGSGFYLIGVYAPKEERLSRLKDRNMTNQEAEELIARDANEDNPLGQQTRATFQLADVFIRDGDQDQLKRFIRLIFGALHETPTCHEHGMFLAFAGSLRSGSLSRQVGAVVRTADGEFVTTGANDVPQFGGGLYWPGQNDKREALWEGGVDSNEAEISDIVQDTIRRVKPNVGKIAQKEILKRLKGGRLYDLTEFGRAVHAELDALLCCARLGVSVRGGTLYTTTFPCHNCAKHIVTAGLKQVFYVEPYPKSKALALHSDSITLHDDDPSKVQFVPFVGVAARRFFDLFSMKLSTGSPLVRRAEGRAAKWTEDTAKPRIQLSPASYILREKLATAEIVASRVISRLRKKD